MTAVVHVRAMQDTDIDNVYAIEVDAHQTPWTREILTDCVLAGYDCRVLKIVNETEIKIAGYVISRYEDNVGHILNLCIAPALQGRGYGQVILTNLIDLPAILPLKALLLEVRPSNKRAMQLYIKLGFQPMGIKEDYYCDEHGLEDAIVLKKILIEKQTLVPRQH